MPRLLAGSGLARRYQSDMALRVTTWEEIESLRLPHPCALVAASLLLNTT
jgi:hypothetical protein